MCTRGSKGTWAVLTSGLAAEAGFAGSGQMALRDPNHETRVGGLTQSTRKVVAASGSGLPHRADRRRCGVSE